MSFSDIQEPEGQAAGVHLTAELEELTDPQTIQTRDMPQIEQHRANARPSGPPHRRPQAVEVGSGPKRSGQLHQKGRACSQKCKCHI